MTNRDGAHELALTIINDGACYLERCKLAQDTINGAHLSAPLTRTLAAGWVTVARKGAVNYEIDFGVAGASCFTVLDILGAALELAEYYENHIRETMTLAASAGEG